MSFICIVCRDLLTNRPDGHGPGTVDVISTKCGHMYHLHCLMEWFRRKVDVAHTNHECPYCSAVVTPNDILRIFPSEDEETEEIAAKFNEAKASLLDKGINQLQSKLEECKSKYEEEQLAHETLKFDYTLKISEIEQLKRDHEVDLSLLDAPQSNWKAMMDKERKSRNKILKTMTTLEKRFVKQKSDMEKEHRRKTEESQKFISDLKIQNESLRKKIERLNAQQQQQPFRPVFPTTGAAAPSSSNGPVSMSVISSSSSQSRRRSAPNPPQAMIFCPNVSSSSHNHPSAVYGMPTFRPPAAQSHFLNPPNPAQNPYQNLLSAAAAAASSTSTSNQNQARNNPSLNSNSNQNLTSSSSSTSSAQGHFQNQNSSGGGQSGGNPVSFNNPNFHPSPFPLPQAHNHGHGGAHLHAHPPPMHLSMHYPSYYPSSMSSRNPPYPPTPYSFPTPPHLSNSATASQLNSGDVQAAHAQQAETSNAAARAAARLLPAHMQFYMQTATAAGMTETVGVTASYPSFLAPSIHPPPLSPRH